MIEIGWILSVVLTHGAAFAWGAWVGGRRLRITRERDPPEEELEA